MGDKGDMKDSEHEVQYLMPLDRQKCLFGADQHQTFKSPVKFQLPVVEAP